MDDERQPTEAEDSDSASTGAMLPVGSAESLSVPASKPWPPPVRVLLYLVACTAGAALGLIPANLIAALWVLAQRAPPSPAALERDAGLQLVSLTLGIYPSVVLVTCCFVWFLDRRSLSAIGLTRRGWAKDLALGVALGIGFVGLTTALYQALDWVRLRPQPAAMPAWLLLIPLFIVVGLAEEIVFRGYLLQVLEEWRGRWFAVAGTSLLFWLLHLGEGNVAQPLGAADLLVTAVLFALCRYASGALWLPIGLHAAFDWSVTTLGGIPDSGLPALFQTHVNAPPWLVGPPGSAGLADVVLTLLLLAAVSSFLYRSNRGEASVRSHPG